MGTSNKNTAKTAAAVMSLLSRRPVEGIVSESGTTGRESSSALQADDRSGGLLATREQIEYIDIDRIDDDPRNFYELSGLDELAANIELLGLQQPIRVRPGEEPGRYVIVSGHRRRAAVRKLLMDGGHGYLWDLPCIQLKADAKAQKQQAQQAREEKERPRVEQIKALWKRFGEARAAAGKSPEECYKAGGMYYANGDRRNVYEKRERLEGRFNENTTLPYGYSCYLSEVQRYVKLADLLGVSLDYLLCRTDDPAAFAPQSEGQLVFNGWMPGGTLPRTPCDMVADFEVGCGLFSRHVCKFDGKQLRLEGTNKLIEMEPVRWMMLPEVVSDSGTEG